MATYQITDTLEDGAQSDATTWASNSQDATYGNLVGSLSGVQYEGGYRFLSIAAPQGAVVSSATFRLYVTRTYKEPLINIKGVASDNAIQFSNSNLPVNASVTTAAVSHDFTGEGNATDYFNQNRYIEFDVTAIVQEIVNRSGWSSGNAIAFTAQNTTGTSTWIYADDVSRSGYNTTELVLNISADPTISSFNNTDYISDSTDNIFTGTNTDSITSVDLISGGVTTAQTIGSSTSTTITLTSVGGNCTYDSNAILRFNFTGGYLDFPVSFVPPAGNGYVDAVVTTSPDATSAYFGASPAIVTGDQFEWQENSTWTGFPDGSFERIAGSTDTTFVYRLWSQSDLTWSGWATITILEVATEILIGTSELIGDTFFSFGRDLAGTLIGTSTLSGTSPVVNKFKIQSPDAIVDLYGQPVTHTYEYWFLTDSTIDTSNYAGSALNIIDSGTNLGISSGIGEATLINATVGVTYHLVAFDSDQTNYFRADVVVIQDAA